MKVKAPFPWFGGKSRVAHIVWERFGDTVNYVEPFAGSLAVLLGRPHEPRNETVNDLDCYLANFWRALKHDPDGVAEAADNPVNEADLHANHKWLHSRAEFREKMHTERDFWDAEVAGVWVWGLSAWIGDNWCRVTPQASCPSTMTGDGTGLDNRRPDLGTGKGIHRQEQKRPSLNKGGTGVHARRAHARAPGEERQIPDISGDGGASGRGVHAKYARAPEIGLFGYMRALGQRLRRVRVCCGDWSRVLGPSPTVHIGTTAVFLDPPYGVEDRDKVYNHDSADLAGDVRTWCLEQGDDKRLRIALCGYAGEHDELEAQGWVCVPWKAHGGYGARNAANQNAGRERIWFSPHCLSAGLFDFGA